ncbi:carboxymethylenebutenolidase [Leptolyngbya sp. Heron Island J]|uniref:dienelactone hydrolase family protein n=1 Tax=Leptolyngbya sp. Heron Island J TaxID=1385935 RepID=UPI0003B949E7|nr:dienelactone hydrolase family protein [Leptolyngbya sp. Heron Island J]ESA34782.1 carboxymethylenebutenolidase [Leptolyngbya sp. Heron Island J]
MRKLLGLALVTALLAVGCALVNLPSSSPTPADNQSNAMAELHTDDAPVASPMAKDVDPDLVVAEDVTYGTFNDVPFEGYLVKPVNAASPLPGLIVIQEWWGLNDNIRTMTRRLAAEGYAALAVDLYDGQVAETPDEARTLVQAAIQNSERLTQNVVAAHNYLVDAQQATKVGSIGWCFGGSWSLNTALALPTDLDAVVIYYGGQISTDPAILEALQMPIQGHFGALDTNPSPDTVQAFETALNGLGKDTEIYMYEGANHAFANPSGTRYNAEAADLSWQRTVAFLKQHLQDNS